MRLLIKPTCLLFLLIFPFVVDAQMLPKLAIDTPVVTVPGDTLYMTMGDSTITYNITLRNVGPGSATGEVDIMFEYNGAAPVSKMTLQLVNFENNMSLDTTITDTVLPWGQEARYGGTGNIIVIWPRSSADLISEAPDTSRADIYIDGLVSRTKPQPIGDRLEIFPNPVSQELKFRYLKTRVPLERVSLIDVQGRTLFRQDGLVSEISMGDFPNGLYFLTVRFKDGVEGSLKVVVDRD